MLSGFLRLGFDESIRSMPPNDPKLSHGHRRLALDCNLDFQISSLNPNLKEQWPLAPARGCVKTHFSTIPSICSFRQNALRQKFDRYRISRQHFSHSLARC
jgi:hypothetical protein